MALRKAMVSSSALTDNASSFTNETSSRLSVRKVVGRALPESTALVLGDEWIASLDEIPIAQHSTNDSRSHIAAISASATGGTGAVSATFNNSTLSFNRGDLVLDPDEALFLNISDVVGAADITASFNIWYD